MMIKLSIGDFELGIGRFQNQSIGDFEKHVSSIKNHQLVM